MRAPFVVAVAVVAGLAGLGAGQLDELGAQGRQGDDAVDLAEARSVDLSHAFNSRTIYWPTAQKFKLTEVADGETEGGWHYSANNFEGAEHGGTHLDAPIHFSADGNTADKVPLRKVIGAAVTVDVRAKANADADYLITPADLEAFEAANGRIARNTIVLLRTGWSSRWPDARRYLGTAERGEDAVPNLHFPGLSEEAAEWLVEQRSIKAVGIDTASIDRGQSTDFRAHRVLAAAQVPVFENVTNLNRVPKEGFHVAALPMKIEGGSGGPLRTIAIIGG
jgi:kynurenine formamidase